MRFPFILLAVLVALTGCAPRQEPQITAEAPPPPASGGGNPLTGKVTTPESPTPPGVPDDTTAVTEHGGRETPEGTPGSVVVPPGFSPGAGASLTATPALDTRIATLEKKPDGNKAELAAAYAERGNARMTDAAAAPRVKYPAALKDFRRALKLDPKNVDAKQSAQTIEAIYTRMGRPVPTD